MHGAASPRDLFISVFEEKLMERDETIQLFSLKCAKGHKMVRCISRVAFTILCLISEPKTTRRKKMTKYTEEQNDGVRTNARVQR